MLKCFAKPPQVVITVCTALLMIVKDQKISEKDSRTEFKKTGWNPQEFRNFLLNYNIQGKKIKHLEMVKAILTENNLENKKMEFKVVKASQAMKSVHQWVLNLIEEVEKNE